MPGIESEEKKLHRFYGSVQISERMMASDAGKIMEEVVKHLTSLSGAKVKVTLEITAELPDGVPDHVVRTVKENSNTLRFQSLHFSRRSRDVTVVFLLQLNVSYFTLNYF